MPSGRRDTGQQLRAAAGAARGAELATLGPGAFVGEIALLRDVPRTATVTVTVPTSLRGLDREHFLATVTGSPAGAVALVEEMDRRLAEHDEREA